MNRGVSVVICNGMQEKAIKSIVGGRKIGTFFTNAPTALAAPVETLAENGLFILFFFHRDEITKSKFTPMKAHS